MLSFTAFYRSHDFSPGPLEKRGYLLRSIVPSAFALCLLILFAAVVPAQAVVLWSDLGPALANETGPGRDILNGAVKRDDSSVDTLYFKFRVNPISDKTTEEYFAAFELYEGDVERLAVGNALKAWAYSAFYNSDEPSASNIVDGYVDLRSSKPDASGGGPYITYQFPRRGVESVIVFKVQYVADGDDLVTVWLNPDLGPGATEAYQPDSLTTKFNANAAFDEIRLRHGGLGGGWTFSDMAIATSFSDFVDASSVKSSKTTPGFASVAKSYAFRSWQRDQGLPNNNVRALAQSSEGYLWIGTDEGLARFDGVRFVPFGLREGLYGGQVSALLGGNSGALWIGTAHDGLMRWQDNKTFTFTTRDGLPSDAVTALSEDNTGRLWVGTDAGLAAQEGGRFFETNGAERFKGKTITVLCRDGSGTLWVGVKDEGVFKMNDGKCVALDDSQFGELLKDPRCLLVDKAGRVWIGAGDDSVLCKDADGWRVFRIPPYLAKSHVNALAEEADETVWVGLIGGGLLRLKDGEFAAVSPNSGLSGNLIESLFIDENGKLWVGTDAGLNLMNRKNLFALGQAEGLGFGAAQGLAEVAPGVVWAGKAKDGLYRWDGRSFNRLTAAGLYPRNAPVNTLLVTRDGGCWVATPNGLLFYKDPRAVADEVRTFDMPGKDIISLAEGDEGELWAGTREGEIWRLRQGAWAKLNIVEQTNAITAIIADVGGTAWIGTDGSGLYHVKNGAMEHFDKGNGLSSDSIRTLFRDGQGTLWIGTADGGLGRLRAENITMFSTFEGLPDNTISQIMQDDAGRLWIGNNRGIACVNERELDGLIGGDISNIHPQTYGRAEGMLSEECAGGFFPAGLKVASGMLWFPTLKGITVMDPRLQFTNNPTPEVLLEEVQVDGAANSGIRLPISKSRADGGRKDALETLRIPPGRHSLEFRYTALKFDAPEQLRFRYQLEGLDSGWVEAGSRRTASYSFVPPGDYHFRVMASGNDGVWVETGSALPLKLQRYFWQSLWFISGSGMALLLLVGAIVRVAEKRKLHRRLRHLEQQRALERERTRIAQDLHDEMGAKLCRISFLSEHARRGDGMTSELQEQIASISSASREVLHSLDEIVWAVNPQNDTLEHAASYIGQYAHDYFLNTGVECGLDIPAQLPPHPLSSQVRHHLFLAVHEALTNILKHSAATRARIAMTCDAAMFEIIVSDNGKGIHQDSLKANSDQATSSNDGLNNMRKRLDEIGGGCLVEPAPGGGTVVRFTLPLNQPAMKG